MDQAKKCLCSLFDISFSEFITPRIIQIVYVLTILLIALKAIGFIVMGFDHSKWMGVLTLLIFAPLFFIVTVIYARVLLELVMVLFRISDNTAKLAGAEPVKPLESATPAAEVTNLNPPSVV